MRIWVDLTAAPHPLVLRPVVEGLRARGHDVSITARDNGQTVALARAHGLDPEVFGAHGGRSRLGKARALWERSSALRRWARPRRFDLALGHGSNDVQVVARSLGVPAADAFDYEWAFAQHTIGCRLARRVIVPEAIPPRRLRRYGAGPGKLARYPGLKEEYYLADFEPDPGVPAALGADPARVIAVLRPPAGSASYHRMSNELFPRLVARLGADDGVHAIVVPRDDDQRRALQALALPSLIVPDEAIDVPSAIAAADLVLSAGGTMNREAVALGTPVWTTFAGRLGAVDERLIAEGRLRVLSDAGAVELVKRDAGAAGARERVRRDPALLVDLVLGTVGAA
ncbi:MAG TPA: DUF354 domain-containing protein [Solirubrobacteraceae bacterium]|nr:DUF354 domain-containing protein [Solirubrobacteraceae bacterium]